MANKPKSIYLTNQSMRLVRRGDQLSARINQVAERYGFMLEVHRARVRHHLAGAQIQQMAEHWQPEHERPTIEQLEADLVATAKRVSADCWGSVMRLEPADMLALVEMLESQRDELVYR